MVTLNAKEINDTDALVDRKIRDVTEGLNPDCFNWLYNKIASTNLENAITIAKYIIVAIFGFLEIGKVNNCPSHVLNVRVPIGISLKETSVEVVSSSMYDTERNAKR